jgi:hypothetical protein
MTYFLIEKLDFMNGQQQDKLTFSISNQIEFRHHHKIQTK